MADQCVVMSTAGSKEEAELIARGLVEDRLAACVQLLPVRSFYRWDDKVAEGDEVLLLVKTRAELYAAVEEKIKADHSYEVPEILQLSVTRGAAPYLDWLLEVT